MRYLHTMLRVRNLDAALDFYCKGLGLTEVRRRVDEKNKFTLVFLAAPADDGLVANGPPTRQAPLVELTYNWDTSHYTRGDGYGHMAYSVDSIDILRKRLQANGYDLSWGPGLTPSGKMKMAFVDDPDGYEIELLEGH